MKAGDTAGYRGRVLLEAMAFVAGIFLPSQQAQRGEVTYVRLHS